MNRFLLLCILFLSFLILQSCKQNDSGSHVKEIRSVETWWSVWWW